MEEILGGIIIALVSGMIGKFIGDYTSVRKDSCIQLRSSCQALLIEKIKNLEDKVDGLTKAVNNKIFCV